MSTGKLTAQRLVERSLSMHRRRVAIVDGARQATYATLAERSGRLANVLLAAGAGPRRPVATFLPNRLEFIEVDVACTRAGITRAGVSDRLGADECRFILADTEAAVLVATLDLFDSLQDDLPDTLNLVLLVDGPRPAEGGLVADYETTLADAAASLSVAAVAPDAPNYILYTSGTTGRPKGATHSQAGRAYATINMLASEITLGPDAGMIHMGPVTHGSGSKILAFLVAGGRNILLPRFDPEWFGSAESAAAGGTHTFAVPTMLQRLLAASPEARAGVSRLQQISFGGSPISPDLFRTAIEAFGTNLTQVYGSCEAPHPITLLRPADYASSGCTDQVLTSAGRVAPGVEIALLDDDGNEVELGSVGELAIRTPHLMLGYWRNDGATRSAFTSDGWYKAGDLASSDDDGLITFRDRKRDLIISGGLNVYPSEVERVIAAHPDVQDVAVVGAPDVEWGEVVVAYVVLMNGRLLSADDVINWARAGLASYKKPRRVEFLERMPLGSSNKILKDKLREPLWRGQGRRIN